MSKMNVAGMLIVMCLGCAAFAAEAPAKADLEKFGKDLGSDDFAKREVASKALIAAGESARGLAEKLAKSEDTEVRERAAEILRTLNTPKDMLALSADQKELAGLPFESTVSEDGKNISFKNYGHGGDFVCDFGNIRVVVEQTPYNGMSSGSFTAMGGGSSSIQAGSFGVKSSGGTTEITFRKLKWTVEKSVMKIAGQEVAFGGGAHKVLFLGKDGAFLKRCDLPEKK